MSVSTVVVVLADNSRPTLRVEALSPSNGRTVDLCTNSVAGSGTGCAHADYADGSIAVHPVISENFSWRTLVVLLDQELHPNQTVYVLIDARAVLDSSGKPFLGLVGSDFSFAVAEQVIVPNNTITFLTIDAITSTAMVVSFAEPVQLAGRNASFRIALRATIWSEMITEMRVADLIVFRINQVRNIRNLMRDTFFELLETVMEKNLLT